jgi:LPS export ABC transporter protein LptC
MRWQQAAKVVMVLVAVGVCIAVVLTIRRRSPADRLAPLVRTDPRAVVESTAGTSARFKSGHEDVRVEYQRQLTYEDGSTKLVGVKISTDDRGDGRSFVVTGKEGEVGKDESVVMLNGDVQLVEKDGFTARTVHASYDNRDGIVRAPGPVEFFHGRLSGSGQGMTYDKNTDTLVILDQAIVHMAPDPEGNGAADVKSGSATFARREQIVRFERVVHILRDNQIIDADNGTAHLTQNEEHIESLELHGNATIAGTNTMAGGLKGLNGQDVTLTYAPDGETLQRATISGSSSIQIAGEAKQAPREIVANTVDITLGPDGSTPMALVARDAVQLTLPADPAAGAVARTVKASTLDADGEAGRGLTKARFAGNVDYREKGAAVDRDARSARLEVGLKNGLSAFEQAAFSGTVRFADPKFFGTAAAVKYVVDAGSLDLSGTEPAILVPHVATDQITVDAARIEVVLDGPKVNATGSVKSVLEPPKKSDKPGDKPAAGASTETKIPSMFKQDQPVRVTSASLKYDGATSKGIYEGTAQLWQADTSVRGDTITIDSRTGDMTASGSVVTTTVLEQLDKDRKTERVRNMGASKDFKYEDAKRLATYIGEVHLNGPSGDIVAEKFEAFLKESGNELERAEAYDTSNSLTLREQGRKTTGTHLTYTSADELYVVTGLPTTIVDQCNRETKGRTLTFHKATDTIQMDGNDRARTQTKGGGDKCP